jgi:hypothetical protein
MLLLSATGEFLLDFPSPRHLSSSGSYPLDVSGLGDPTGSNATTSLALTVTGTHKLYHGKVEIPTKGPDLLIQNNVTMNELNDITTAISNITRNAMLQPGING